MSDVEPFFPPWGAPLGSLLLAAYAAIQLAGGQWWMYALLGVLLVDGAGYVVFGWRIADAVTRIRVDRELRREPNRESTAEPVEPIDLDKLG